jgi:FkbM family methyltransferase
MSLSIIPLDVEPELPADVRVGLFRMSDVEIEVIGRSDDLYHQGKSAPTASFEPAVSIGELVVGQTSTILDIGACLGSISMVLGALASSGRVVAVEALPGNLACLATNLRTLAGPEVTLVHAAVGSETGEVRFHTAPGGSAWGHIDIDGQDSTVVPQITIDQLVDELALEHVDLIKLDIEGFELHALEGAVRTFQRFAPTLIVELNPYCLWRLGRTLPQDLLSWLRVRYPFVWAVDDAAVVRPIVNDHDANDFVHRLAVSGVLADVVASTTDLNLAPKLWDKPTPQPASTPHNGHSISGPRAAISRASRIARNAAASTRRRVR